MKMKIVSLTVLLIVVLFVLAACSNEKPQGAPEPPKINLLSKTDAKKFILEHLDLPEDRATEVRLLPELVRPNSFIDEIASKERYNNRNYNWFFFIDEAPGAVFPHTVKYGFLDPETQKIETVNRRNLPTINGEAIWETPAAYLDNADVIYTTVREGDYASTLTLPSLAKGYLDRDETPALVDRNTDRIGNDDAVRRYAILLSNRSSAFMDTFYKENLEAMAEALKRCGYQVPEYLADGHSETRKPYIDLAKETGYGLYQLRHFVRNHDDHNDRDEEILIYLTGDFGLEKSSRGDKAYVKLDFGYAGEKADRKVNKRFYGKDLADIISSLESNHIGLVVDGSHADGFLSDFKYMRRMKTLIASCESGEYAYTHLVEAADNGAVADPHRRIHGENGTEFTSSFAKGLNEIAKTASGKGVPINTLLSAGYRAALENDLSAIAGVTHPVAISKISKENDS
ncbi:MAG: hypothetical protein AAGB46_20220 [Verrucomicrobiota bacterium]